MKMKRKHLVVAVAIFVSIIIIVTGVVVLYNVLRNAFISDLGNYICENYSVVKSITFKRYELSSYPCYAICLYIDQTCTFDQARVIFEDLVDHFTDDFIVKLRNEKGQKGRFEIDFAKAGKKHNDISIYTFQTRDTENFIHWRATRGNTERYEFDRQID